MSSNPLKLEGRVALITGASRGIGRSIAHLFAREGCQLALAARNTDSLKEVASEIQALSQKEPFYMAVDVKNAENVQAFVDKTLDKYSRIDILVNNAGVTRDGLFVRMSAEDWADVLDTNLKGSFFFARAVTRPMMKERCGRIINIASVVGLVGNAGQANYAASKGGLIAMTKSLAKELGSRNILVNALAPGFIVTEMTQGLSAETRAEVLKSIPLGRFGEAEDVAQAALFLASDESRFITGQVITVDGGMVM